MSILSITNELNYNSIAIPILSHPTKHYHINRISFIYVYDIETGEEGIVNYHHNDFPKQKPNLQVNSKYVLNAKYLGVKALELNVLFWLNDLKCPTIPSTVRWYQNKFKGISNLNDCIPIVSFYPYLRQIRDLFLECNLSVKSLEEYSEYVYNLSKIERSGIMNADDKLEYCEFNPYTVTGRPSNHFGNVNYAGLTTDMKRRYKTRFGDDGILIEFDMKAFHVFLLSTLIEYSFPDPDIYAYFQQYYGEGINAKDETFRQIYGGIDKKYMDIEFFAKVDALSEILHKQFVNSELRSIYYERMFKYTDGFSKSKVLNYVLQSYETEYNAQQLKKIFKILEKAKATHTKLILYTYDSFLFDVHKQDAHLIQELIGVFDNVPFRLKKGKQYSNLTIAQ